MEHFAAFQHAAAIITQLQLAGLSRSQVLAVCERAIKALRKADDWSTATVEDAVSSEEIVQSPLNQASSASGSPQLPDAPEGAITFSGRSVGTGFAVVMPRQSIRIVGLTGYHQDTVFDRTFGIGDTAAYGGYNLTYFGTITGIGPKTVAITESGGRRRRLTIEDFAFWNREDQDAVMKRNAEWYD